MFTTPVVFITIEKAFSFVNPSALPNEKNFVQKSRFIYEKRKQKQMFAEIPRFK